MPNTLLGGTRRIVDAYGAGSDPCTRMVLACLIDMGVQYNFSDVKDKPGFLDNYPFAKLPVVQDGNRLLFEARDIIKHYAKERKGQGPFLLDESGKPNKEVDEWLLVEEKEFYPLANALRCQLVSAKWLGFTPPDQKVIVDELGKVLDKYKEKLQKNDYLAGKFYSVADLIHLPFIHYIVTEKDYNLSSLITGRPSVNKWWKRISTKDNWKKALAEKGFSFSVLQTFKIIALTRFWSCEQ